MAQAIEMIPGGYKVLEAHKYLFAEQLIPFGQPIPIKEITKQKVCKENSELRSIIKEYANEMRAPFYGLGESDTQVQLYVENMGTK